MSGPREGYLKVYMKSTTKVKRSVLDYSWVSMVADIGGYVGLLLGISLVHVNSVIDWAYASAKGTKGVQ